jgi:hypothetical protein
MLSLKTHLTASTRRITAPLPAVYAFYTSARQLP